MDRKMHKVKELKVYDRNSQKVIMTQARGRNRYLEEKKEEEKIYARKRETFVSVILKSKRSYFFKLDLKMIKENRKFKKTLSPLVFKKV